MRGHPPIRIEGARIRALCCAIHAFAWRPKAMRGDHIFLQRIASERDDRYNKCMSYVVIKIIKGRRYRYVQTSWRDGKRVRTKSICLGPLDGVRKETSPRKAKLGFAEFLGAQRLSSDDRALATAERQAAEIEAQQRAIFGETATERAQREHKEHLDKLHDLYGLKMGPSAPMPAEKETIQITAALDTPAAEPDTAQAENDVQAP
jgi:hypothetical protein